MLSALNTPFPSSRPETSLNNLFLAWKREKEITEKKSMIPSSLHVSRSQDDVKLLFSSLLSQWKDSTMMSSNATFIITHPAHFAIIGLGPQALPYIFKDLENGGGPWFIALQAITQQSPANSSIIRDTRRLREIWLKWGKDNDYI